MFNELAKKRRSIRKYTDEEISEKDLNLILESALLSPTGKNLDSKRFIVIKDKEMLEKLSKYKVSGAAFLKGASVAIAVVTNKELAATTYNQDACIAATFIQLQAEDLGLGSCWGNVTTAVNEEGRPSQEVLKELLEVPEEYNVECVIGIGHKAEEPREKKELDFKEHVFFEKFRG
ncbi:nitroreductase family protein [Anaerosphaera multitolerans]|uniref:Nitroreductase n=1 Tax=Anaerosphaera multitolerans TaxID=2487351 RepID=A0A437S7L6_9FIRM|nr:nitroreductase family protein [Anaerosphaera multitolerans]RVU55053.1 nitroreductase [Anaerosphaera multitolerans]